MCKLETPLAGRPRILVFAGEAGGEALALPPGWEAVRASSLEHGLNLQELCVS